MAIGRGDPWNGICYSGRVQLRNENDRIGLLLQRDGLTATKVWVQGTLESYRRALQDQESFTRTSPFRRLYEASVQEFEGWLAEQEQLERDSGGVAEAPHRQSNDSGTSTSQHSSRG